MTRGSDRSSSGEEEGTRMTVIRFASSSSGKLISPSRCSGRSATRISSQVFPSKRKTPGLSRHSIFMDS